MQGVEAWGDSTGFQTCDRRLGGSHALGKLGLGESQSFPFKSDSCSKVECIFGFPVAAPSCFCVTPSVIQLGPVDLLNHLHTPQCVPRRCTSASLGRHGLLRLVPCVSA